MRVRPSAALLLSAAKPPPKTTSTFIESTHTSRHLHHFRSALTIAALNPLRLPAAPRRAPSSNQRLPSYVSHQSAPLRNQLSQPSPPCRSWPLKRSTTAPTSSRTSCSKPSRAASSPPPKRNSQKKSPTAAPCVTVSAARASTGRTAADVARNETAPRRPTTRTTPATTRVTTRQSNASQPSLAV